MQNQATDDQQDLSRVLVVDDNCFHQACMMHMLRRNGYIADTVDDGSQAVAAVLNRRYIAVLMDVEMPVMDGLAATREIRSLEKGGRLPGRWRLNIFAATACNDPGIAEKCLEAGMDAFFNKPLAETKVVALIHSVAEQQRSFASQACKPKDPTGDSHTMPAATHLNLDAFLERCLGDRSLMSSLMECFQTQAREDCAKISDGLAHHDLEAIRSAAHSLKGASAYLAAEPLRSAAERLERAAKAAEEIAARQLFAELEVELRSTFSELQAIIARGNEGAVNTPPNETAKETPESDRCKS